MRLVKSILYPILLLAYTGCAGSGSGTNGSGSYSAPLGIAIRSDFFGVILVTLVNRHQYQQVRTEENPREIYFETAWKHRPVFADEVDMQIEAAQAKIIVRGITRRDNKMKVQFYVQNRFQYEGRQLWDSGPISENLREHLDELADELRTEFKLLY